MYMSIKIENIPYVVDDRTMCEDLDCCLCDMKVSVALRYESMHVIPNMTTTLVHTHGVVFLGNAPRGYR